MNRSICVIIATLGCGASALYAGTGAWNVNGDGSWSNSANWVGGAVADGSGSTAFFTNALTARRTVTVDQPVTVEALRFSSPAFNNWRLIGDGPIFLDGLAKPRLGSTVNQRVEIFTPLAGTNGFIQENVAGDIELSGNNSRIAGLGDLRAYTVVQTMSKTAEDAASLARNYFPTSGVILAGARFELLGRKNGSATSSAWALTAGSALAQSASLTATASLAPGQTLSGAGVPDGTFIRQILDGSNLVLSAAADQTVASTLTFAAALFRSEQLLQRVRVDNAQTFKVHKNGGTSFTVAVERVYGAANWSLSEGDGAVEIPGQREHRGAILLNSVDLTLKPRTVARQPAPGAAFHVDASRADTLTLEGGNAVAEWRDADGGAIIARPPGAKKPTLLSGELNGLPTVDFGAFGDSPYAYWYTNGVAAPLTNIRAVFWVLGSQNGGGFLLGGTSTAHFHRGNPPNGVFEPVKTSSRIWGHDWGTYPGGGRVETYIDGIRRDDSAALGGGYQVITCTLTTNATAGGFAFDRGFGTRRGGQRLAEVLIYEREVSEQERIETEEYLTAKWFGDTRWDADGKEPAVTELAVSGTRVLNTPDAGTVALGHLAGVGKLTKNGASALALTDAQDFVGSLVLAGGGLKLAAAAIPAAPAADAYFHVDASVADAFTLTAEGRVAEWRDWRGNGLAAAVQDGYAAPSLVTGGAGGLPLVDFGALGSLQALHWNHTNNAIRAAFVVFQSLGATASLLGCADGQPQDFYRGAAGQLYHTDATASRAVVYGANRVNGWRVEPMVAALPSGLCVISVIPTTEARASAFALDRNNTGRSGGQRLAEVLLYNRALTEQERRETEAYLMRKWLRRAAPGYGAGDTPQIPALSYGGASLSVEVAGDGVVGLGQLTGGGTVVKSGSGTLAVGDGLNAVAGAVEVTQGAVSAVSAGTAAPAPGPVFHVDASRADSLALTEVNGTNFVTRWRSLGVASNAAVERAGFAALPYVRPGDLAGKPAVDFGLYGSGGAGLKWETSVSTIRAVFVVLGSQEGGGFLLGALNSANFHRGGLGGVLNPVTRFNLMFGWDVSANVYGGATYVDAARVPDPRNVTLSGEYQLIEIHTAGNVTADQFAMDRSYADRSGGQRLAEVLVYDRPLTEGERMRTVNYLNAKWFGRGAAGAGLGTVRVADGAGVDASVAPMTVNRLEGAGTMVKSGADVLTLTDTTAFTGTVDVVAGTLNLAVPAAPRAPPAGTLFWVDASKAGTLDTDASGNVTAWRDASGNGRYATPVPGRYPTLRGNDFAGRPAVDMGPYGTAGSAGMYWNERISGMKSVAWVLGSQASGGYLLGAKDGAPFHRGPPPWGGQIVVTNFSRANYMLSQTWSAAIPTAAYTNGVAVNTTTTALSGGYQLLFMTWNGGTYADGFAFDRTAFNDRYGGQRLAEFIAYDRVLTEEERLATDAYLNQKWFGKTTPGYAQPDTQVGVILRQGATLTMNGTEQSVTSLSGAGAVSNGTLVVTGTLSPGVVTGECVTLDVAGGLTLASGMTYEADYTRPAHDLVTVSGTLTVAGGGVLAARLPEPPGTGLSGRVAVAAFGSISGASNLRSWSVTGLPSGYAGGLVADEATLFLEIRAKGLLIVVK
jgi:hypothetical protein